jgi:FO synthase
MEAPMYLKGRARRGPTFREALLMHAVARLVLHGLIDNIQASWVKMGAQGVAACLGAGVNDLGGTLMNESITRAAGSGHGQEWAPEFMEQQILAAGRQPRMRTTGYGDVSAERRSAAFAAQPLAPVENASAGKRQRSKRLVPVEAVPLVFDSRARTLASRRPPEQDRSHLVYEQVMLMAACN